MIARKKTGPGRAVTEKIGAGEEKHRLRLHARVYRGADIAMGPGKAMLLQAIGETGTIASAAQQLGMSYMRAWSLIRTMNASFQSPLVVALRGGQKGGRAELTPAGREVLRGYEAMARAAEKAAAPAWRALRKKLRP